MTKQPTPSKNDAPSGSAHVPSDGTEVQQSMLTATVLRDVRKSILEEQASRRAALLGIVSIFALVVVAGGGLVVNGLVEDYIDDQIGEYVDSVALQSSVAALNVRAIRLDQQPGFDEDEATELIESVTTLHASAVDDMDLPQEVRAQNRTSLTFAVETIATSFAAADRQDLVSEITNIAPEITRRSPVMTQILVLMMARNLIGAPGGVSAWQSVDGDEGPAYADYRQYGERARHSGFPELSLVFELIIWHMEGRPQEDMLELISDIGDLDTADRDNFENVMGGLVRASYTTVPTATTRRISDRTRAFLNDYAGYDPTLMSIRVGLSDPRSALPSSSDAFTEIELGEFTLGEFRADEPTAWHTFGVIEAMAYRIDVIAPDVDPLARIWSADDESAPLVVDDDGGANLNARIDIYLEPGVYYLSVEEVNGAVGRFFLRVSSADVNETASWNPQTLAPPASAELEGLVWQSIMNSTNQADFEVYLEQFPTGSFRRLAENRLRALREPVTGLPQAGRPEVAPPADAAADARRTPAPQSIDFGDDTSEWAQDGECDDLRFEGKGMASSMSSQNRGRDAADCRRLFDAGRIRLFGVDLDSGRIDFGDDASEYAGDGECDDPRFEGEGTADVPRASDRGHDAADCRRLYDAGRIRLFGVRPRGVR